MSTENIERIDWDAEREAMQAPAYFAKHAQGSATTTGTARGQSPEERGARTLRSRERLSDSEIKRLNAARRRNGGETL